ncbi:MAG: EAL domain-containing protein [Sulfuricurvum sp.]|nr:EAL domain-containing protein [Sulfuricurvum sp.]MDD5386098.1 EAL domain-containing protein [Sulfuricurvum sp.]
MQLINHRYKSHEELKVFLETLLSTPCKSILIQLFSGVMDKPLIQSILDVLIVNLPTATLIGATTAGEIMDGVMSSSEIILSFSLFDATDVSTYYFPQSDFENGVRAAQEILTDRTKVCIAFSEGLTSDSESFLDGFTSIRSDVMVAGGNAGDDLSFTRTYVMQGSHLYDAGIVIAVLDSDFLVANNAYSLSWTPVGKLMTITKVEKNVIYEIDNHPVRELYTHYLGAETVEHIPASAIEFPLIKIEDDVPIARSMIAQSEDGGFVYAGHFHNGDQVRFAIGNVEEVLNYATDIQATITSFPVEATYIYSCSVRKLFLQEQLNYEFGLINDIASTAGFFTYGEFFHSHMDNQLLNITTTTLSLSESERIHKPVQPMSVHNTYQYSMLKSLTHLVNVTQEELDENIRKLMSKERTIERQLRDELTGVKNRTALFSDMEATDGAMILVVLNIDLFSNINDYYGYEIGDQLLGIFAKKLREIVGHDSIYRISGDEFAVICTKAILDEECRERILDMVKALENYRFLVVGHGISLDISAGVASAEHLNVYNLAHIALKEAKERRVKVIFFDDYKTLETKTRNNIVMVNTIKSAIENNRIIPYFQGIVDNQTRRIVKYEALIRLIDEDGHVLSPYVFLEHAKKSKLYDTLTQIMVAKTFEVFEPLEIEFSINLTLQDIQCEETRLFLYETLQYSKAANRAVFEIVESEGIENFEDVALFIKTVKEYGCKIAIDDFGTGYSNFSYLSKLDVDYIKIDGSLIKNINNDTDHLLIVESILFFAHKKGIETIAEFVEDEATFTKLLELGVTYTQGYLFSIPSAKIKEFF